MESYQQKIARVKQQDLSNFMALKPNDFVLIDNIECQPHFTFVCMLPPNMAAIAGEVSRELKALDATMIFNPVDKLHLTIFHCSLNEDIEGLTQIVHENMAPIQFQLDGIRASNLGMGISAIPTDDTMLSLREQLFSYINKEVEDNARGVISWVTLARSTQQPPQSILDYLISHMNDSFGGFSPTKIELYKSTDKNLIKAEKIEEFNFINKKT